jgi:hypothetical protein
MDRDLNYTSKEMAMLQHDFKITFFLFAEMLGFN